MSKANRGVVSHQCSGVTYCSTFRVLPAWNAGNATTIFFPSSIWNFLHVLPPNRNDLRGYGPLKMTFEDQLKALVVFHLSEHTSAQHILQILLFYIIGVIILNIFCQQCYKERYYRLLYRHLSSLSFCRRRKCGRNRKYLFRRS